MTKLREEEFYNLVTSRSGHCLGSGEVLWSRHCRSWRVEDKIVWLNHVKRGCVICVIYRSVEKVLRILQVTAKGLAYFCCKVVLTLSTMTKKCVHDSRYWLMSVLAGEN